MTALHRSAASLGFRGDDLDPDELTAALGGVPTVGVRKGGIWHTSRGAEKIAIRGMWRVETERCEPGDLDSQINALLAPLTRDLKVWCRFAARYEGNIFAGLFLAEWNEGVVLEPATLAALGERGLRLDLDIYGHETREPRPAEAG